MCEENGKLFPNAVGTKIKHVSLHQAIRAFLLAARVRVRQTVNGKQVLPELAKRLSEEFGAGFDVSNLRNMRQFFQAFPIREVLRLELSWTHYRSLIRIDNPQSRDLYAKEAADQG